jgi:hypothetical protein
MRKCIFAFLLLFVLSPLSYAKSNFIVLGNVDKMPESIKESILMETGILSQITGDLGIVDLSQVHLILAQQEKSSIENVVLTLRYFQNEGCSTAAFTNFVINEITDSNSITGGFQVVGTVKSTSNHGFQFGDYFRLTFEKKLNSKIIFTFEIFEQQLSLTSDFQKKSQVIELPTPIITDNNPVVVNPNDSTNVALIKSKYESDKKALDAKYQSDNTNLTAFIRSNGDKIGVDCTKAKDDNLVLYGKNQDQAKSVYYASKIGANSVQSKILLEIYRAALDKASEFFNTEKTRLDTECKAKKDKFALDSLDMKTKLYNDYKSAKDALKFQYDTDIRDANLVSQKL